MILEQVQITIRDEQEAAFEAALCLVRQRVFMSPGFRGFTVAQGAELTSTYLVQIRWNTLEELTEFADSDRFARSWAPIEPFLAGPARVSHFVERPTLDFRGPGTIDDLASLSH